MPSDMIAMIIAYKQLFISSKIQSIAMYLLYKNRLFFTLEFKMRMLEARKC